MKNLFLFLTFSLLSAGLYSQMENIQYLDKRMEVVASADDAFFKRIVTEDPGVGYQVTVSYLDDHVKMTGTYLDQELTIENGFFVFYHHQGGKESQGYYMEGHKTGPWKRWDYAGNQRADKFYSTETAEEIVERVKSTPASFEGGYGGLVDYISENLQYPEEAKKQKIEGEVTIAFVIDMDGKVKNVSVFESDNYYLEKEALRLVNDMPDWTPARKRGEAVESKFVLPLTFRLPAGPSDQ